MVQTLALPREPVVQLQTLKETDRLHCSNGKKRISTSEDLSRVLVPSCVPTGGVMHRCTSLDQFPASSISSLVQIRVVHKLLVVRIDVVFQVDLVIVIVVIESMMKSSCC